MKVTKWVHKGNWGLQQRTLVVWEAVCPRCGAIAQHGYTEDEAIAVAEEEGWRKGICPECYAQELGS
jgi:ribosomal protein L40E